MEKPTNASLAQPKRVGLAQWLWFQWPEGWRPEGGLCTGDVLSVPVEDVSGGTVLVDIDLDSHVTDTATIGDGPFLRDLMKLKGEADVEWLLDRYGVEFVPATDEADAFLSVHARTDIAYRVYRLWQFCQAVYDYQTGRQSRQYEIDLRNTAIAQLEAR